MQSARDRTADSEGFEGLMRVHVAMLTGIVIIKDAGRGSSTYCSAVRF